MMLCVVTKAGCERCDNQRRSKRVIPGGVRPTDEAIAAHPMAILFSTLLRTLFLFVSAMLRLYLVASAPCVHNPD